MRWEWRAASDQDRYREKAGRRCGQDPLCNTTESLSDSDKESESWFEGNWEPQQGVEQQQPCTKMP